MYSNAADGARISPSITRCGAFRIFHRPTALVHSPGSSASAMIRARASSPRLVSWVAVAVMPCGHSVNGKVTNQTAGIFLARNGIACLSYDPIGQGERYQFLDDKGPLGFAAPYTTTDYRSAPWLATHLRTFRAELFHLGLYFDTPNCVA